MEGRLASGVLAAALFATNDNLAYAYTAEHVKASTGKLFGHAVLFDALIRFGTKEKRSPLDWLVISPFKALYKALALLNRYPAGCLPVGVLVFGGLTLLDMEGLEWAGAFFAVSLFLVWLRVLWNVCTGGPTSDSDG